MKASDFIKRFFLILLVLIWLVFIASCQNSSFNTSDFQEVDFNEGQKILLDTGDDVYNLFVSFNENYDFELVYLPEASEILLGTTVVIKGEQAIVSYDELEFSKNINDFNNSFVPKIIYIFLKTTDLKKENFVFDSVENSMVLTNNILEKNVVFTVRFTQDKQEEIYMLEIR